LDWKKRLIEASGDLKKDGVNILTIGTDQSDMEQLKTIASSSDYVFRAMDIDQIVSALQKMSKDICYEGRR